MSNRYHHSSSIIGNMIAPCDSIREKQKRAGIEPKNFMRENAQQIKCKENEIAQKQLEQEQKAAVPAFRLKEFENAQPKIQQTLDQNKPDQTHQFLRKNEGQVHSNIMAPRVKNASGSSEGGNSDRQSSARQVITKKGPIPEAPKPKNVNFIKQNKENSKISKPSEQVEEISKQKLGQIPDYLRQRKMEEMSKKDQDEWEKQERARLSKIPRGCREVGDDERVQLLAELKEALNVEQKRLHSFKFTNDTQSGMKAREDCADKIEQLEKTIRDFQRQGPLYLAID
ncbi:Calmodulin-binding protein [Spironucleus salmonicida]|uniref:Calmodulin-binding protein n=1 Tax=Spironucleus salmonicida TaxID=348837 RepID=V6M5D6_9EUKA|nr:Calmodulin-binding protein [Spironucleus salmonicida]|eukprot:EST48574.1 hypothetical protein SS50377_11185 [Spironucleus salmonicida]